MAQNIHLILEKAKNTWWTSRDLKRLYYSIEKVFETDEVEARRICIEIIHDLGEMGHNQFRQLLPED